jgi:hypothetical protein
VYKRTIVTCFTALPQHSLEGTEKNPEKTITAAGLWAEKRIPDIPNKEQ